MKKGFTIKLTSQEVLMGSMVGQQRRNESLRNGLNERHGADLQREADRCFYNIAGAVGEVAFAKASGLYWPMTVNVGKGEPDVFPDWQVRWSSREDGDLIVRPNDNTRFRYALMTGSGYNYTFMGWIPGVDAVLQDDWYKDVGNRGSPAWFVPQCALLHLEEDVHHY